MEGNKTFRPRLVFEGLVIVVSILIAFGLDTWWDDVKERREEHQTLLALQQEFISARDNVIFYQSLNQRVLNSTALIVEALDQALESGELMTIIPDSALAITLIPPTTSVNLGTLSGLISSGRLGIIQNLDLRGQLGSWGVTLEELGEEEIASRRLVNEELFQALSAKINIHGIWDQVNALIGMSPGQVDPPSSINLPVDKELMGLYELRWNILRHTRIEFGHLLVSIDAIIQELEKTL